jgi:hypothetical protein
MPLPRFRIRTLMIAVAVVALLMVVGPPWWRYWFQSPWRLVTLAPHTNPDGNNWGEIRLFFDTRKSRDRQRLTQTTQACRAAGVKYTLERFATFPKSRFPTFSDVEVRCIDPLSRD